VSVDVTAYGVLLDVTSVQLLREIM